MAKKKIALVGFHLYGGGGARIMANLSIYFAQQGMDVHNIIIHDELGYHYEGRLYNLGKLKSERNSIFNKIKRLVAFSSYVNKQSFDYIIDFRFRKRIIQELLIGRWVYRSSKTIYTLHSSKLEVYLPTSRFWAKMIYGKSHAIIALTRKMEQAVRDLYPFLTQVVTIPNAIDERLIEVQSQEPVDLSFDYVIAVGAFDNAYKQFDKLIGAYAKSVLVKNDIHLVILGSGQLLESLQKVAVEKNVEDLVHFLGNQANPFKFMAKAKFLVLSSALEGFPMVLIEALACGIPLVSFNCETGPSDIIVHEENGLLVEHQNLTELVRAINRFVEDPDLYHHCKSNAVSSASRFYLEQIGENWLNLLK